MDFNQCALNGGNELFENDPQWIFTFSDTDLETFRNLFQLRAETDFSIPEYHQFLIALPPARLNFYHFSILVSPCVLIKWISFHTSLLLFVCDPNLMTSSTGKH